MIPFLVKGLNRSGVFHQSYDHISIAGIITLLDKDVISVEDAGINHTFSLHLQHKGFCVGHVFHRNREIGFNVLHSKDRFSRSYTANNRHINHLATCQIEILINDLDGTRLCRIPADISVLLQRLKMRVYRGSGFEIHRFTDIANRRRIPFVQDLFLHIFQNFSLLIRDLTICHKYYLQK